MYPEAPLSVCSLCKGEGGRKREYLHLRVGAPVLVALLMNLVYAAPSPFLVVVGKDFLLFKAV